MSAVETLDAHASSGRRRAPGGVDSSLLGTLPVALVAGGALAFAARHSALMLLVVVAVVQGLVVVSWVFGTGLPGRKGALVLAALAAGGADTVVSVWPHSRLGTLLAVVGLAIPVMYVHQLSRGAARTRLVESLSMIAVLVLSVVALAALIQLRHELRDTHSGPTAAAAVAAVLGAGLVAGCLVDLVIPQPRFDAAVPRGMAALLVAGAVGGAIGYLVLHTRADFAGGRTVFIGAALAAIAQLTAVASTFLLRSVGPPASRFGAIVRPAVPALLPICLLSPAAFLLCLSIRS